MRKAFLFIALSAFTLISNAQLSFAPRVGIGLTSASLSGSDNTGSGTISIPSKTAINFSIGAEARYRLTDILSIHSGLFYNYIQAKNSLTVTELGETASETLENKLNYLSLPIQLIYGKTGVGFYGGAGINFSLGISGKATAEESEAGFADTTTANVSFDGNKNPTDNNEHFKALNIGIALKAGYCFNNNVFVGADAVIGLTNLNSDPSSSGTYKLTTYGVHVGYILGSGNGSSRKKK